MSSNTGLKGEIKNKVKKPSMYKVYLINDDYSTMDFVVEVIIKVFRKTVPEATKIMFDVHKRGRGLVGIFTYDIAITKISQVELMAEERGYPLKAGIEEE